MALRRAETIGPPPADAALLARVEALLERSVGPCERGPKPKDAAR